MDVERRSLHDSSYVLKTVLVLFGMLRVLNQIPVLFASHLRPLILLEARVPVWPPVSPLARWLTRVVLLPWQRWDVTYYLQIATRGYAPDDGTAQFHPLFPWMAKPLVGLGVSPLLALLAVSSAATVILLILFVRLARLDMTPSQARNAASLLLCSPFAFALFVPYPESLFLVWAVLCLYWSRQQRWLLAGLAGALATLTRQQGLFLLLVIACEVWTSAGRDALRNGRAWAGMALPVLGYGAWVAYRAFGLQDVQPNLSTLHSLVYSVLISPSAASVVPVQSFMWPWQALGLAWQKMMVAPDVDVSVNLAGGIVFVVMAVIAWPRLRLSYRVYTVAVIAVSFAYQTGPVHPYMGLLRHLLLAFPVFLGLGSRPRQPMVRASALGLGVLAQSFLILLYGLETWVP